MNTHPITDQTQDQLAVTRWRLDPAASTAEFQVPHFWGLVTVKGHFERFDGWLDIDESQQRKMTLTIDAASLHTGIRKRDKHLRAAAFFDTQKRSASRSIWRLRSALTPSHSPTSPFPLIAGGVRSCAGSATRTAG